MGYMSQEGYDKLVAELHELKTGLSRKEMGKFP